MKPGAADNLGETSMPTTDIANDFQNVQISALSLVENFVTEAGEFSVTGYADYEVIRF
jgi:hypothetical protein